MPTLKVTDSFRKSQTRHANVPKSAPEDGMSHDSEGVSGL
jgi:hypothetical protein